jgi:hypothetical protein
MLVFELSMMAPKSPRPLRRPLKRRNPVKLSQGGVVCDFSENLLYVQTD